ncbi:Pkinase domain-containing protein, partial [Cephalotus follicularis]
NPPYIHKNLKTSNILLDGNFRAKLANFGLARMVENDDQGGVHMTRHVVGTHGYMAPEYIENGVVTPKLDVFGFGVVVLELLSGREAAAIDKKAGEQLLSAAVIRVLEGDNVREKLRGFIDPSLKNEYPLDLAFSMAQQAKLCVADDPNARPAMSEILVTLSKILSSTLDWDPSDELDCSRSVSSGR